MITELFSFDLKKSSLVFASSGCLVSLNGLNSCLFAINLIISHFSSAGFHFVIIMVKKTARFLTKNWEESSGQTKGDLETIIFTRKQKLAEVELEIERVVSKGYILTPNNFKKKFKLYYFSMFN